MASAPDQSNELSVLDCNDGSIFPDSPQGTVQLMSKFTETLVLFFSSCMP